MFFFCEYVFFANFSKKNLVDFFKNGHREVKDRMKTRCGFFCSLVVTLSKSVLARCFWPTPERVGQKYVSVHDFGLKFLAESESAVSWSIRSTVWHLEQLAKKSTDNVTIEMVDFQKRTPGGERTHENSLCFFAAWS